jgi:hypothetical protein
LKTVIYDKHRVVAHLLGACSQQEKSSDAGDVNHVVSRDGSVMQLIEIVNVGFGARLECWPPCRSCIIDILPIGAAMARAFSVDSDLRWVEHKGRGELLVCWS